MGDWPNTGGNRRRNGQLAGKNAAKAARFQDTWILLYLPVVSEAGGELRRRTGRHLAVTVKGTRIGESHHQEHGHAATPADGNATPSAPTPDPRGSSDNALIESDLGLSQGLPRGWRPFGLDLAPHRTLSGGFGSRSAL
jgi:hypothetical protein